MRQAHLSNLLLTLLQKMGVNTEKFVDSLARSQNWFEPLARETIRMAAWHLDLIAPLRKGGRVLVSFLPSLFSSSAEPPLPARRGIRARPVPGPIRTISAGRFGEGNRR